MTLKETLSSLDGLDDRTKALYNEVGGEFILHEDFRNEDISGLKNALEKLKAERVEHKKMIADGKKLADNYALELAKSSNDVEEVKRLKQEALTAQKKAIDDEKVEIQKDLKTARDTIYNLTVGAEVERINNEIYTHKNVHKMTNIQDRISLEDGEIIYKNNFGSPILQSEFINELKTDKDMLAFIKASEASGGVVNKGKAEAKIESNGDNYSDLSTDEKLNYLEVRYKD
jgi:hypothetical protein